MNKKVFKTGDIITPEFLNALQNPSFDRSTDEVGGLPLPPEHSEMNQVRTFSGFGASITIDLGDWDKNSVILHKTSVSPTESSYPTNCSVSGHAASGFLLYMPIGNSNDVTLSYCGNSYTCHKGAALLLITQYISLAHTWWCKAFEIPLQGAEAFFNAIKTANNISVGGDIECDGSLTSRSGTFEDEVSGDEVIGKSVTAQNNGNSAFFDVHVGTDGVVTFQIKGNSTYNYQTIRYDTNTGCLRVGHSYVDNAEWVELENGRVLSERRGSTTGSSWIEKVAIQADFNIDGEIQDSSGGLSMYSSSATLTGSETRKVTISPYGIKFYKINSNQDGWEQLNSFVPNS